MANWPTASARDWNDKPVTNLDRRRQDGSRRGTNGLLPLAVYAEPSIPPDPENPSTSGRNQESSEENKRLWMTPRTNCDRSDSGTSGRPKEKSTNLGTQACIAAKEDENWPTPRAGNPGSRKPGTGGKILAEEVKKNMWATPQASDYVEGARTAPTSNQKCLGRDMNRTWRSPAASDGEGGVKTLEAIEGDPAPKLKLRDTVNHNISKTSKAKLNPNWVEQLMGLPGGWTQLPPEWMR